MGITVCHRFATTFGNALRAFGQVVVKTLVLTMMALVYLEDERTAGDTPAILLNALARTPLGQQGSVRVSGRVSHLSGDWPVRTALMGNTRRSRRSYLGFFFGFGGAGLCGLCTGPITSSPVEWHRRASGGACVVLDGESLPGAVYSVLRCPETRSTSPAGAATLRRVRMPSGRWR
jgi:hypothetical protein